MGPEIDITTHQLSDLAGVCAMMTILDDGYVLGSCLVAGESEGIRVMLTMFDNENLDIVAERDLGFRPFVPNSGGGAYFSLDGEGRIRYHHRGPLGEKMVQDELVPLIRALRQ